MNQYEWLASNTEKRMEAIDLEVAACNRKDSSTFDTGVRQLRHDIPPISEAITKPSLWTRIVRRLEAVFSAKKIS